MFNWILEIPNLYQNFLCGSIGAFIVALYQIYRSGPGIEALLAQVSENVSTPKISKKRIILKIVFKILLSIIGGALVSALLIRPQESFGAIVTGMTWTIVIEKIIRKNQ